MGRIRTIKPEFPQSESMGRVSRNARLLFIMLWTICDDAGRARASSRMLASLLFPYDDDAPTLIDDWLGELEAEDCVVRYEHEGNTYLQINKWLDHQKIDKPSKSRIPEFTEASRIVAKPREPSALDQGPRTKEGTKDHNSVEDKSSTGAEAPEVFRPAWWPKRDRYGRWVEPAGEINPSKIAYDIGRMLVGPKGGGQVTRMAKELNYNWRAVLELLLEASDLSDPKAKIGSVVSKLESGEPVLWPSDIYPLSHSEYAA